MTGALILLGVIVYLAFHVGHGVGNYRHRRHHGRRRVGLVWYLGRGPWLSVPLPGGFRVGHKL